MDLSVTHNYYEILGVPPDATEEDIKRAYAKRRRELQQAASQDDLAVLLQAKAVLTDPQARKHYDARLRFGPVAQDLHAQAVQAALREDWKEAVALLKQVLALVPTSCETMHELGIALFRAGEIVESLKVCNRLVEVAPEVPTYSLIAAKLHLEASQMSGVQAYGDHFTRKCPSCFSEVTAYVGPRKKQEVFKCPKCGNEFIVLRHSQQELLERSRQFLLRTIELDPKNAAPYIQMAFTYVRAGNIDIAAEWAEKAITADGKVDIQDVDDLLLLCDLYVLAGMSNKLFTTIDTLLTVSDNANFTGFIIMFLTVRLQQAVAAGEFRHAALYCAATQRVHFDAQRQSLLQHLSLLAECVDNWSRLCEDENISDFLKIRFHYLLVQNTVIEEALGEEIPREKVELLNNLKLASMFALRQTSHEALRKGIHYTKRTYPAFYKLDREYIDGLEREINKSYPSAGCSTYVLPMFGIVCALWWMLGSFHKIFDGWNRLISIVLGL